MGEAWFLGDERRMFTNLMGGLEAIPPCKFSEPLKEIASGTVSFGRLEEWDDWFHYLLPGLIPRTNGSRCGPELLQLLITAFMALYPADLADPPYRSFRDDVIDTLGRAVMDSSRWCGDDHSAAAPSQRRRWLDGLTGWAASGDLSATMFFHLRYLSPKEIPDWLETVLAIGCRHWRAQMLAWFVGAHGVLCGRTHQPSDFSGRDKVDVAWSGSDWLGETSPPGVPKAPFFPQANCDAVLQLLSTFVKEDIVLDWWTSIAEDPELDAQVYDLPVQFLELYS